MTNKALEKYDGKTVRIVNKVYVISIIEGSDQTETEVRLHPKYGGDDALSSTRYDSYEYIQGGEIYKKAVEKAEEILLELEQAEETDF